MFDAKTKLMGLIGSDTAYTLSPFIHNFAIKQLRLNMAYLNFDVSNDCDLGSFLRVMWDIGAVGFNITTPFKRKIASLLALNYPVNTIYRGSSYWSACSTDGLGFKLALERAGQKLNAFEDLLIIGNGGVVESLLFYFMEEKLSHLRIKVIRRDSSKDIRFSSFSSAFKELTFLAWPTDSHSFATLTKTIKFGSKALLIHASLACEMELKALFNHLIPINGFVFDLNYGDDKTIFHRLALAKGLQTIDGLSMLVEQALASQTKWWGRSADFEGTLDALMQETRKSQCSLA